MACEFPVAVKSKVDAKLLYTVYFTYFLLYWPWLTMEQNATRPA